MISTDKQVRAFAPAEGRTKARSAVTNNRIGGLAIEARSDRTAKKWLYRFRIAGRQFEMQLGAYPAMKLAEAREAHKEASRLVEQGIDPRKHRAAEKARNETAWTMQEAFERWIVYYEKTPGRGKRLPTAKTVSQQKRRWRLHLAPRLADMYVRDVSRRFIIEVLEDTAGKAKVEARHCLNLLRSLLEFSEDREQIEENPIANLKPGKVSASPSEPRKRHLRLPEIRLLWQALDDAESSSSKLSTPVINALRVLVLTGARRGEVVGMRWAEIDKHVWTIPAERTKSNREHKVFLAPPTMSLLERQRGLSESEFVFASLSNGAKPIHADTLSTAIARLQGRSRKKRDEDAPLFDLEPFHGHDLRRSAATAWAEVLLADPFIIEMMLAHAPPKLAGTYNRAERWKTQADIWARWAATLSDMTAMADDSNVVAIRG